jgi:filamentous hemagglutinin
MLGTLLGPTQGLTQRQKEAQTNLVSSLVAAVAGMAGQDTQTATMAAVTEGRFNRQLYPPEKTLAQQLAEKSGGKYSPQQIEDQMRQMSMIEGGQTYAGSPDRSASDGCTSQMDIWG